MTEIIVKDHTEHQLNMTGIIRLESQTEKDQIGIVLLSDSSMGLYVCTNPNDDLPRFRWSPSIYIRAEHPGLRMYWSAIGCMVQSGSNLDLLLNYKENLTAFLTSSMSIIPYCGIDVSDDDPRHIRHRIHNHTKRCYCFEQFQAQLMTRYENALMARAYHGGGIH